MDLSYRNYGYRQLGELSRQVATVDTFRGADLRNTAATVDPSRSPESLNMIRDEIGQVRKRMGYHTTATFSGRINGAYLLAGKELIHAGGKLYGKASGNWAEIGSMADRRSQERGGAATFVPVGRTTAQPWKEGLNATAASGNWAEIGTIADRRSQGWTLQGKLYLLDGEKLRVFDGTVLRPVEEVARIPILTISRAPTGGGEVFEAINLLQPAFQNSFLGTAGSTVYQLTDSGLDSTKVSAQVMQADGSWKTIQEGSGLSVNRTTGAVTFTTAPGVSPVLGVDNVIITAVKTRPGYRDKINKCTVATLFGVNGAADRLFLSGNPQFPNQDWYSEINDPTLFGDLSYSVLGQDNSAVVAYSVIADRLAAHKDVAEDGRNVILRSGLLQNGKAAFPIVGTLQGEGSLSPYSHLYLGREPLFLTRRGIYAITAEDVTGEKYSQGRSLYLNARLTQEASLDQAVACVYNDFYLLAVNSRVYVLDGLQRTYARGEPYSSFQYEGYLLDHIPARVMWVREGVLSFGTEDGRVCSFYTDKNALESYNDDGAAIRAYWDTPYFSGKVRHNKKWFTYLSLTLAPHSQTSVKIWGKVYGIWKLLVDDQGGGRYFDWNTIDFTKFSFSTDTSPHNIHHRIDVRYVDKLMLRLENDAVNEPFGLYDLALEYTEGAKF